ncbi:MAG: response regulator [bacterium]
MTMPTNKTILIADDDEAILNVLTDSFSAEGFNILSARNGKEALDMSLDKHPDILLLDIMMPIMAGLETLEKLRQDEWGKSANVILLTNLNDSEKVAKAAQEGVFDYLIKSDKTTKEIIKIVKNKLGA